MKIVLIDEQSSSGELTFQQETIKIGRNAHECQISFARDKFPMVSRHHAEIQHRNNSWVLVDTNSSYGTFLNNNKLKPNEPNVIQVGSALQFGVDGPVLIVILLETGGASAPVSQTPPVFTPPPSQQRSLSVQQASIPQAILPQAVNLPPQTPAVSQAIKPNVPLEVETPVIELVGKPEIPPFLMKKDEIWLGRDLSCDIVIEPGAAMVSRRHAQISRQNHNFILTDNKSFNGTLVKEQRISTPIQLYHGDEIQLGLGGPILRFNLPSQTAPKGASLAGQRAVAQSQNAALLSQVEQISPKTMVLKGDLSQVKKLEKPKDSQLLMSLKFGDKTELVIGRGERND
ncbi:MAG TPA: FHA domain-containing protein, partial [Pyrinomonadaceae bacterium]|nr:FHA domain-containing protein [Pyrinomonadaceae bacterium]